MERQVDMKAFAGMCVQALSDDVELRQEVEAELLDHLEDAYEEECQNATPEEALSNTFKRFGNPEEISGQLVENNAARLSRDARIRRAAKWLLLPLVVVGVLVCIDVRGIMAGTVLLQKVGLLPGKDRTMFDLHDGLKTRKLSDDEQSLFDYYYWRGSSSLAIISHLYEKHHDDTMICAIYAQELSQPMAGVQEKLPEVLANGRRIDPDNPLYDYLECLMLMREGCQLPRVADLPVDDITILDRGKLDGAIAVYWKGLSKGKINTHNDDLLQRIRGMLKIKEDLLGGMHLIDFRGREKLYFLSCSRSIATGLVLYCDLLNKEGSNKKAVELLATWRTFIPQFLDHDNVHFLDLVNAFLNSRDYLECAKRLGAEAEIAALQAVMDINHKRTAILQSNESLHWKAGVLAGMALAFSNESEGVSEWSNERRLEAAVFDTATIGFGCLCLLIVIALLGVDILAMRLGGGRHPFLFIMPRSAYTSLLMKGMLFPALIYLAMTYFVAGKGGPWLVLVVVPIAYLCLVWPLYYGMCCRRMINKWTRSIGAGSHEGFKASRSFNLLCLFVALLFFFGCVLRPMSKWREHHYADMETLVIPRDGVETLEHRAIRKYKDQLLKQVNDSVNRN